MLQPWLMNLIHRMRLCKWCMCSTDDHRRTRRSALVASADASIPCLPHAHAAKIISGGMTHCASGCNWEAETTMSFVQALRSSPGDHVQPGNWWSQRAPSVNCPPIFGLRACVHGRNYTLAMFCKLFFWHFSYSRTIVVVRAVAHVPTRGL